MHCQPAGPPFHTSINRSPMVCNVRFVAIVIRQIGHMQLHCKTQHGWVNDWKKGGNIKAKLQEPRQLPWRSDIWWQRLFFSRAASSWFEVKSGTDIKVTIIESKPTVSNEDDDKYSNQAAALAALVECENIQLQRYTDGQLMRRVEELDPKNEANSRLQWVGWTRRLRGSKVKELQRFIKEPAKDEVLLQQMSEQCQNLLDEAYKTCQSPCIGLPAMFEINRRFWAAQEAVDNCDEGYEVLQGPSAWSLHCKPSVEQHLHWRHLAIPPNRLEKVGHCRCSSSGKQLLLLDPQCCRRTSSGPSSSLRTRSTSRRYSDELAKLLVLCRHGVCWKEDTIGRGGGVDSRAAVATRSHINSSRGLLASAALRSGLMRSKSKSSAVAIEIRRKISSRTVPRANVLIAESGTRGEFGEIIRD